MTGRPTAAQILAVAATLEPDHLCCSCSKRLFLHRGRLDGCPFCLNDERCPFLDISPFFYRSKAYCGPCLDAKLAKDGEPKITPLAPSGRASGRRRERHVSQTEEGTGNSWDNTVRAAEEDR